MRLAALSLLIALSVPFSAVAQEDAATRSPITNRVRSLFSALEPPARTTSAPSHPLIIRIHEKAFTSTAGDRVDTTRPVSCTIIGTPVSGTSRTQGTIHVDASSAKEAADFLVSFKGRSFSRTIGVNGPARIHSHTVTDFVVSRHVTFSPLTGFESKQTSIRTRTTMTLDEVRATRPGLRGALVRRVGWRRAQQSHRQAEREADGNVRRDLLIAFNRQLDERVADLNDRIQVARYAQALLGGVDELDVTVCTSEDCVELAVGKTSESGEVTRIPHPSSAPVEVWLHENPLEEDDADRVRKVATLLATGARTISALQTLTLVAAKAKTPNGIEISTYDGWTILSFDPLASNTNRHEIRVARHSTN